MEKTMVLHNCVWILSAIFSKANANLAACNNNRLSLHFCHAQLSFEVNELNELEIKYLFLC
jgi:hypothetical protein